MQASRRPRTNAPTLVSLAVLLACLVTALAHAQQAPFELPPAPRDRAPVRAGEVHFALSGPLYDRPLCPRGARCVLGPGGGFGFSVERRWQSGFTFGLGYDVWFQNGGSVYELTTLQVARVIGRYLFRPTRAIHPFVTFGGGIAGFGDTFRIDTGGPVFEGGVGLEIEISPSLAFTGAFAFRGLVVVPYRTDVDGVRRGGDPAVSVLSSLQIGLVLLSGP